MVQVPSIDADLEVPRARRRVGGFDDGDTVKVDVRDLSLLPSPSTVGELLSTSTTDMGDVLSKELSAEALSSSSSLGIAEVRSVPLESKGFQRGRNRIRFGFLLSGLFNA